MILINKLAALLHRYFIISAESKIFILTFFFVTLTLFLIAAGVKMVSLKKGLCMTVVITCVFLVFVSTVISRFPFWNFLETIRSKPFHYYLIPFHSYIKVLHGNKYYALEVLFNVLMLFPAGALLAAADSKTTIKTIIIFSSVITLSVEFSQLVFKCGTFETDDIIHNILGCVLGYLIYRFVEKHIFCKHKQEKK